MRRAVLSLCVMCGGVVCAGPAAELTVTGDWQVKVEAKGITATLAIAPAEIVRVEAEAMPRLPLYAPKAAQYARGAKLNGVRAQECTVRHALDPESLKVMNAAGTVTYTRGRDYEAEISWGCVGRLEGGAIGADTPVRIAYTYGTMRLDAVVLTTDRRIVLRRGDTHVSLPELPPLAAGERRLASIWITPRLAHLTPANLFPVLETAYPEPPKPVPGVAERLLPKTMATLKAGGRLRVLAWGDSVTDAGYLPEPTKTRWQEQFVRRLRAAYPAATIELVTEAWGGRNTGSYFNEPPGSPHNYQEKVLDARPDLVVSEFVNDAGLDTAGVERHYGRIRDDLRKIGAEWIILTPHYVRPDWMGLTEERHCDDDPRAYVKALRVFAADNNLALADASLRWGRLWRQGIPYSTLLMNNINHPNPFGMSLFADALMAVFP